MVLKKSSLVVNDVLEELSEENKRILNELIFADKCLISFIRFKTFIDFQSNKFKTVLNVNECQKFKELDKEINEIVVKLKNKAKDNCHQLTEDNVVYNKKIEKSNQRPVNVPKFEYISKNLNAIDVKQENRSDVEESDQYSDEWMSDSEDERQDKRSKKSSTKTSKKRKNTDQTYSCDYCDQSIHGLRGMNSHVRSKHPEKAIERHVCDVDDCGQGFSTEDKLKSHKRFVHSIDKPYACDHPNCEFSTGHKSALSKHKSQVHNRDGAFVCTFEGCGNRYGLEHLLNQHMRNTHIEPTIPCTHCDRKFKTKGNFNLHVNNVHLKRHKWSCAYPGCQYTAGFKNDIERHYRTNHIKKQKKISGNENQDHNEVNVTEEEMVIEKPIDINDELLFCDFCGKSIQGFQQLVDHIHSEHPNRPLESRIRTHICDVEDCLQDFETQELLNSHKRYIHSIDKPYACDHHNCEYRTKEKIQLDIHKANHHNNNDKSFVCPYDGCGNRYAREFLMRKHIKDTHTEPTIPCTHCDRVFKTRGNLNLHINNVHLKRHRLGCSYPGCDVTSIFRKDIERHYRNNHIKKRLNDGVEDPNHGLHGNKAVVTNEEMVIERQFDVNEEIFFCDFCGKSIQGFQPLVDHIHGQHPNRPLESRIPNHICDIDDCCLEFDNEEGLNSHKLSVHSIDKPYACDHPNCEFRTRLKTTLISHKTIHSGERPFGCTVDGCDKRFALKSMLKKHLRTYHVEKSITCTHEGCDKMFKTIPQLNIHVNSVHLKQRKFTCEWPGCDYTSWYKTDIARHRKTHTKERPFLCDFPDCGQAFGGKFIMENHKIIVHKMGEQLCCHWPGCDYATYNKTALKHHESRHATGGDFACSWPGCDKRLGTNRDLVRHINAIHKRDKTHPCPVPGCEYRTEFKKCIKRHLKTHNKK